MTEVDDFRKTINQASIEAIFQFAMHRLQSVYLTRVGAGLASALFGLIGHEVSRVSDIGYETSKIERDSPAPERDIEEWERRVEDAIVTDAISEDRKSVV